MLTIVKDYFAFVYVFGNGGAKWIRFNHAWARSRYCYAVRWCDIWHPFWTYAEAQDFAKLYGKKVDPTS